MAEQALPPLTQYALDRLRKLAEGNGVPANFVTVSGTEEKIANLSGILQLTPKAESNTQRGAGKNAAIPPGAQALNNAAELTSFIEQEQQKYSEDTSWFQDIQDELDALPGKGWGLDNAQILHDKRQPVAAYWRQICPACEGRGHTVCELCLGKTYTPCRVCNELGYERCYNCFGSGREPQNNEMVCHVCSGSTRSICRTCQGRRGIPCPQCKAQGVVSCPPCGGVGQIVDVCTVTFGIDVTFGVTTSAELPASIRRTLDRQGVDFITKGHATAIDYAPPGKEQKPGPIKLNYTATVPCADIVMQFGQDKKRLAVFGVKRMLIEVPPFLDNALMDGVEALEASKSSGLDKALKLRAFRDACRLILSGQGHLNHFRRLYPYGISKDLAEKILRLTKAGLHRTTVLARYAAATTSVILAGGAGAALYLQPIHHRLGFAGGMAVELALPVLFALFAYAVTGAAAQLKLRSLFPNTLIKARHQGGQLALIAALLCLLLPFGAALLRPEAAIWLWKIRQLIG